MWTCPKLIGGVSGPVRIQQVAQRRLGCQCAALAGNCKGLIATANQAAQKRDQAVGRSNLCVACAIHASRRDAASGHVEAASVTGREAWCRAATDDVRRNKGLTEGSGAERRNRELLILSAETQRVLAMTPDSIVLNTINIGRATLCVET